VAGSNAVGQGLRDGTAGGVTAVVTAALSTSAVDENVCAAKELADSWPSDDDFSSGCGSASTFTSTASSLLSGAFDVLADSVAGSSLGFESFVGSVVSAVAWVALPESGFFVGRVVSSSSSDSELV
jgi:hypothetical protein